MRSFYADTAFVVDLYELGLGGVRLLGCSASTHVRQSVLAACLLVAACNESPSHTSTQPGPQPSQVSATTNGNTSLPSVVVDTPTTASAHTEAQSSTARVVIPTQRIPRSLHPNIRQAPVREQQQYLVDLLRTEMHLNSGQTERVNQIVRASEWLSFGNPKVSRPSMTQSQCLERRAKASLHAADDACGAPNMIIAKEPTSERPAALCVDQYEFPNVECEYPIIWVRSSEAAQLCEAVGKRLCDAHEWEGACAGEVLPAEREYPWAQMPVSIVRSSKRAQRLWLEYEHNRTRDVRWAYGKTVKHEMCGTGARKDSKCNVVDFSTCSSSTYPAGAFPECVSPLGVYDQHGNAAEHMNLPLQPEELTSHGGLGWTEMKGSWFIFTHEQSHPDDCRWRAKSWHTTKIGDWNSHRNYHLGFRCCKDVPTSAFEPQPSKSTDAVPSTTTP
jgi:formylglycine-generating enzyme